MHFFSRKRRRTALNGIVIMAMLAGMYPFAAMSAAEEIPPGVSAARLDFNDIQGHWAEQTIAQWAHLGWAKGHEDGSFQPEQRVTRAEFVALANRMYGYTERAASGYVDVAAAWYAKDVEIATAAGYISGYQDHTFRPNEPISRQEAAAVIAGLLGLEQPGSRSMLKFDDEAAIPSWSQGAIAAVVDQGYMKGYPDGTFRPAQSITRAEAIVALDRTAAMKIVAAGTYGPDRQVNTIHGNVIITSADVTLHNVRITGNLLLAQSVGERDVTLNGITVEGSTIVSGGGEHSVHVIDSQLFKVIVDKKTGGVRIVASGSTFASVILDTPNVFVDLQSGSINELNVNNGAAGTKLSVAENANVDTLVLDSNTEVTGEGRVKNAKVNVNGSTFDRKPDQLEMAEGVVVAVNDSPAGETGPAAGGSNGGNGRGNSGNGGGNGSGGNGAVQPTVASVASAADIEVVYGTELASVLSLLAETTILTDSAHAAHTVNLSWSVAGYDGNQAGVYTAVGTFALPAGVAQANPPVPLQVTARVTVKAVVIPPVDATVVSVTYASDVAVDFGTTLAIALSALDQTATVTDSVYMAHTVNLSWTIAGYDGNQTGVYTATGTFALPSGVLQANPPVPLSVTANVTVNDPYIVSIADVTDIAVDFGTSEADAIAALATETTITDKAGMTHTVNLSWTIGGYDGNQAGVYMATGTFILPSGVSQAGLPVPLNMTANVTVNDAYIVSIADVTDVEVEFGTSVTDAIAALATTTTVTDNGYAAHTVNLNWTIDGYNGDQAGVYTATATFILPGGVSQANPPVPLSVTASVTVNDPYIVSIADVTDVEVEFGTSEADAIAALATETAITDKAGTTHTVSLSWAIDSYDYHQAGVYTATGTFILPGGVSQANPPVPLSVTANVAVQDPYIVSVADVADIEVEFGTSEADAIAALATTTTITDKAGATHTVDLDWTIGDYSDIQATHYTAAGTFILPGGVSQATPSVPLRVTATVTVKDPYIVSIADVADIAVEFGTSEADVTAALATETTITDKAGMTHPVNLSWAIDSYDYHQAGVYTATGTFILPGGVSQANPPVPSNVTATVTVNDAYIVSVADVPDIEIDFGTSEADAIAALADTTTVTDNVNATHTVNLVWTIAGYDGDQAGVYAATGTFTLPADVVQADSPVLLSVTANVTVNDRYIVSIADVTDVEVEFGTSEADALAALADAITVTDNVGATHPVNLSWTIAGYNDHQAGVYTATGTFDLPSGVTQANPPVPLSVTANVTVSAPSIVSIAGVTDAEVEFGTSEADAIAALASTTTITDKAGATHTVNLSWTIDGYNGAQAEAYTATGTFNLPSGVSQATPTMQLEVNATVTVKDFNILSASTSGDAAEIVIGFEAPLAAPTSPAGLTVTVNGVSNPVVSTTLDADPSKLRIGLATSVPVGAVSVSYEPPGLNTVGGSPLPAFSDLAVPTAGSLAEQLKNDNATLSNIVDTLKTDGYSLIVVVQALHTNDYNVNETATALKTAQVPADSAAAGLLYAGNPVASVAAALKQVYLADSKTVSAAVLPMVGTADGLVAALASAGFTQPLELTQALYATTDFTVAQTAAALWSHFSGTPGQLGSALTGAGYSLSDAVAAVLALNGGNNTADVAAAWPGVLGESGTLASVEIVASNLRSENLTASETNALLITLYPTTYKTDANLRVSALKTGGYDATDVARILESDFYKKIQPGASLAIMNALSGGGYSTLPIAQALQTVFGYDAAALATNVFAQMGFTTLDTLQMLQQAGFGDNDIAKAAVALMPGSIKQISPFLHELGYSGEQAIAMLKSALMQDGSFNVTGVTLTLSSVTSINGQYVGYYSTDEIASVLQKVFGSSAETVGVEILKLGNVYDLQGVASALQSLYEIDGFEFIKIRNASYTAKGTGLTSDLAGGSNAAWQLLPILKDTFGMNATEALAGLRDATRSSISTVMTRTQSVYGTMTVTQKIEAMTQAGYNFVEIAAVASTGQTLAAMVGYLYEADYSAEAVAQYLKDVPKVNDVTTADNLLAASYGSCANLEPIIIAMKQVYQSDDARLLDIFMGSGRDCTSTEVSTVLAAMGSTIDFPLYATTDLYTKGAPAAQAVSLLQQVYAKSDAIEIANLLKQVGYNSRLTMTAIRSTMGLSPSAAKSMLASVFNITGDGAITQAMKEIGYSVADIVPLLGTTDPFVLRGYLQAANVQALGALIQLYGPDGAIHDPLQLSNNLKALGVDRAQAAAIMQSYGYTPAEIGLLLWSNGYELAEVAAGVNQTITPVTNEFWTTTMAKTLKQMTTCTGGILADLPACSTGNSTFTYTDVINAIAASLGNQALDCSDYAQTAQCSVMLDTMRNADYSVPTAAGTLYTDYHLSLRSLSALLQNTDGYTTPKQIADLLKQAPFNANAAQIADALHNTTFSSKNIHAGLMDVTGGEEAAFRAMKDGGYSILELTRVMRSYSSDRSHITTNLQALGYSHIEALNAVLAVYPISVEEFMGMIMDAAGGW